MPFLNSFDEAPDGEGGLLASHCQSLKPVANPSGKIQSLDILRDDLKRGLQLISRHGCSSLRDRNLLLRSWDWATWPGCACRKSNSRIQMMKSAKKWRRKNATNGMYCSRRRRVLVD
jgi:hypothetical protein